MEGNDFNAVVRIDEQVMKISRPEDWASGQASGQGCKNSVKNNAKLIGAGIFVTPGRLLAHVIALCQFHLDGVIALLRLSIVASRPATLESAVEHSAVFAGRHTLLLHGAFDPRVATGAAVAADIEIGQLAFE